MLEWEALLVLTLAFFLVATLYASVGFGGGSSYLALLSLVLIEFFAIRSIALVCNTLVVSGSLYWYIKKGHTDWKMILPFIGSSVPLAFWGAKFELSEPVFFLVLGFALITSASALFWQSFQSNNTDEKQREYPVILPLILGAVIGFLSGLVGIGGGILLAPILNHLRYRESVKIAALASFFILVNSLAGLGGLWISDTLILPWNETILLLLAVLCGGQLGIRLSLARFSPITIKRVTAILVFAVGIKVLWVQLPEVL